VKDLLKKESRGVFGGVLTKGVLWENKEEKKEYQEKVFIRIASFQERPVERVWGGIGVARTGKKSGLGKRGGEEEKV